MLRAPRKEDRHDNRRSTYSSPAVALFLEDGRQVAHLVPEGAMIRTDGKPFSGIAHRGYMGREDRYDVHAGPSSTRQKMANSGTEPYFFDLPQASDCPCSHRP